MTPKRGLVLGKFLPYHVGHAHLIRSARTQVDELTVLVCSIAREPIAGGLRYQWVRAAHPDCRVIHVSEEVPQAPEDDPHFWHIWTDLIERHAGEVDVVFTSENYGDELGERIGAEHVSVDRARTAVPTSGSAIRDDPMSNWEFIPPEVRSHFVRRVAIVGTESTGKTTLARNLAEHFGTVWVPEFGREYCDHRDANLLESFDFEAIVWGQATLEDEAADRATRVLICDTELHTTCTWSDLIIGSCAPWLTDVARSRSHDLILFLDADVPWVDDGTRVLSSRRAEHTMLLRAELEAAGKEYVTIGGDYQTRFATAVRAIERLLQP